MGRNRGRWRRWLWVAVMVLVPGLLQAAEDPSEARMRKDITFLASEQCQGRGVSTEGINLAADFIAQEFKKAGLKPSGPEDGYFQPFKMFGSGKLESPNTLVLRGPRGQTIELVMGKHFQPLGLSGAGQVTVPLVFVGYGITSEGNNYDDYKGVDVTGKVVVVLRKSPRADNPYAVFDSPMGQHAALVTKMVNADMHKAAAVVFVNDPDTARAADELMTFNYSAGGASASTLPAVHVRRAVVEDMVQSSLGSRLHDLEETIDRDLKPRSGPLSGWSVQLEVNVRRPTIPVKNVVGVLEGTGPRAQETIVIGAHYDHLGFGGPGSLARGLNTPTIHPGADDNGSGTTALLELARRLGQMRERDRRLVFIAFSGEESGLLGSEHYCKHPLFPLADTVTMVNMDMVGRLRPDKETQKDKLIVYGTGTAKTFDKLIEQLNESFGFKLQKVVGGDGPSDHASFYAKNIPVFFFFTGDHADYHRPGDTADKINVAGMKRVTDLVEKLVVRLSGLADRPEYVKVARSSGRSGGMPGPRLGIMPSYGDDKDGVLIEDVAGGGPAEKAGLKGGDRIVDIGGKPVKNIQVYMVVMGNQKKGQPVDVGFVRDGKKQTIKVTLE